VVNRLALILLVFITLLSCKDAPGDKKNPALGKTEMEDLNIYLVKKDKERIENYIERRDLKMKESPTGLWYQIIKEGEGEYFGENDKVIFNYECSLLDGTKCYSSDELGSKEVILGRTEIEAGLNEGFKMLKPGAEAIFILPPYLAYGFVGDRKKIPSRAVIVYYVTILAPE
jgi:FKBP-type peptidyl-prolyl cis-trans isomerase FkpA